MKNAVERKHVRANVGQMTSPSSYEVKVLHEAWEQVATNQKLWQALEGDFVVRFPGILNLFEFRC